MHRFLAALAAVVLIVAILLLPLVFWQIKRYQHGGYCYSQQAARFEAGKGLFYKLGLKLVLLSVLVLVILGIVAALSAGVLGTVFKPKSAGAVSLLGVAMTMLFLVVYLGVLAILTGYSVARLQNLSWGFTRSRAMRFSSQLRASALMRLNLRNMLLTFITLGLYRPFAVVNTTQLRLQAVSVKVKGDVDAWVASAQGRAAAAGGEMSGDFFGIDVGL